MVCIDLMLKINFVYSNFDNTIMIFVNLEYNYDILKSFVIHIVQ